MFLPASRLRVMVVWRPEGADLDYLKAKTLPNQGK
jgi:hypothetical protein